MVISVEGKVLTTSPDPRSVKKPKLDDDPIAALVYAEGDDAIGSLEEQEEALLAFIEHRAKECDNLRQRVSYYKSELEDAEERLIESQEKLAHLRERLREDSAAKVDGENLRSRWRPLLLIPNTCNRFQALTSRQHGNVEPEIENASVGTLSCRVNCNSSAGLDVSENREKLKMDGRSNSFASLDKKQKENQDLTSKTRMFPSPNIINFQTGTLFSSHHKRKLRNLELCPVHDHLFATSALDGLVNLWEVQAKGSGISLLSTIDCLSPKQRKWPEDMTWHPGGDSLFSTYNADSDGDIQISILNLNASEEENVTFLEHKPHRKGIINSIRFMPWTDLCFMTGGCDHAVILWQERNDSWKPKMVHEKLHSSSVTGVAGLHQKKIVLSSGVDKRIVAFDLLAGRCDFKHQTDSRCLSVLPNPSDFNLFLAQTGTPEKQLRLYDVRMRKTEIHSFGWKQERSESQSALINQAWSPDGLYVSSGSADPVIHIFDIRYDGRTPSQSIQAHQKRVFKALWHQSLPLLTSISSDLHIGLHKII